MKLRLLSSIIFSFVAFSFAQAQWNATGVVLSPAGYIATCNLTVDPGYHLEIDVYNNDIKRTYSGNIVKSDPTNDLAIIKIDDPLFSAIGTIPYALRTKDVKESEKISVMGFPTTGTDELLLRVADGAVNSKSGYVNDIGSYQLSNVTKKGLEGAPVFDNNGYLIGILNSKTEQSMGYAAKASCLNNLIETLPKIPALPVKSTLGGLWNSEREEALNKFVVTIRKSNQAANENKDGKQKLYIGQTYAGGIIFYLDETGEHGLIVSIDNGEGKRAQWGCIGAEVGETETGIGTGKDNTKKIIVSCRKAGTSDIAARLCNEAIIDGYSDWFLPSKEELNLLYERKEIIGGYEHGYYWSSSEFSADFAWYQHFDFGFQDYLKKDFSYYYRPIRAF